MITGSTEPFCICVTVASRTVSSITRPLVGVTTPLRNLTGNDSETSIPAAMLNALEQKFCATEITVPVINNF